MERGRHGNHRESSRFLTAGQYARLQDGLMGGVFTASVSGGALDEAPMDYKSADQIIGVIGECVDIQEILKPAFNFKAQDLGRVWHSWLAPKRFAPFALDRAV